MGAAGVTWSWDCPEPPPAPREAVPAITLFVSRKAVWVRQLQIVFYKLDFYKWIFFFTRGEKCFNNLTSD